MAGGSDCGFYRLVKRCVFHLVYRSFRVGRRFRNSAMTNTGAQEFTGSKERGLGEVSTTSFPAAVADTIKILSEAAIGKRVR